MNTRSSDLRRENREAKKGRIRVGYTDQLGEYKVCEAPVLDVSETGMRVELPDPLKVGSRVGLQPGTLNVCGTGQVKHCRLKSARYTIGLQFLSVERQDRPRRVWS